jgi:hypothetical protein
MQAFRLLDRLGRVAEGSLWGQALSLGSIRWGLSLPSKLPLFV